MLDFCLVSEILPWSLPGAISYTRKWSTSLPWKTQAQTTAVHVGAAEAFPAISENEKFPDVIQWRSFRDLSGRDSFESVEV